MQLFEGMLVGAVLGSAAAAGPPVGLNHTCGIHRRCRLNRLFPGAIPQPAGEQ